MPVNNLTYKLEFGKFDNPKILTKDIRKFIPILSETMSEDELQKRLALLAYGYKPTMLKAWIYTNDNPRTFILGDEHGYRIIKIIEPVKTEYFIENSDKPFQSKLDSGIVNPWNLYD